MVIAGFLVQVLPDAAKNVEQYIMATAGLTSYGLHDESCLVVVAESTTHQIEATMESIQHLDGVLSVYLTSLHTEDAQLKENEKE